MIAERSGTIERNVWGGSRTL